MTWVLLSGMLMMYLRWLCAKEELLAAAAMVESTQSGSASQ